MELTTQRLRIRSFQQRDADPYSQIVADPRVVKYLGNGHPHSHNQASDYVSDCIQRDKATGIARFAVELRATGEFIGFCGFKDLKGWIDFGYRLAPDHWGSGYATEAGDAVIKYGWARLHFNQIVAGVMRANSASVKVLRKLNFRSRTIPDGLDHSFDWFELQKDSTLLR